MALQFNEATIRLYLGVRLEDSDQGPATIAVAREFAVCTRTLLKHGFEQRFQIDLRTTNDVDEIGERGWIAVKEYRLVAVSGEEDLRVNLRSALRAAEACFKADQRKQPKPRGNANRQSKIK